MRWVHLTDLHYGRNEDDQENALARLVAALHACTTDAIDVIVLTGDIAFSGKREEYQRCKREFLEPLRDSPHYRESRIIAVPGNHDIDCLNVLPTTWGGIGSARQKKFFQDDDAARELRRNRADGFRAFADFLVDASIEGLAPTENPTVSIQITKDDRAINFICICTAYFSDLEVSDERKTPAPVAAVMEHLNADSTSFILGHHPIRWFTSESQQKFNKLLVDNKAVYLHGHEHKTQAAFASTGLLSLGIGSSYIRPISKKSSLQYRSTFALCELNDSLHVAPFGWDGYDWMVVSQLQPDFCERSNILAQGYRFDLPTTRIAKRASTRLSSQKARMPPMPRAAISVGEHPKSLWVNVLQTLGLLGTTRRVLDLRNAFGPEKISFLTTDESGHHLVIAIAAPGHVLSYDEVQNANTELDTKEFDSCIILTLGKVSEEASKLGQRLARKKAMTIISCEHLCVRISEHLSKPVQGYLQELDSAEVFVSLVFSDESIQLMVRDSLREAWFHVIAPNGRILSESDTLISQLRKVQPELAKIAYLSREDDSQPVKSEEDLFDEEAYLSHSHSSFNDVLYAPLAAIGLRFENAKLKDVYVPPTADLSDSERTTEPLIRALREHLDSLDMAESQRVKLEAQLRSQHGIGRLEEASYARSLYHQYGNMLILGDPGSGKSCFVKHEILDYCRPPDKDGTWYRNHIPVFVPLAAASKLLKDEDELVRVASTLLARRELKLSSHHLEKMLSEGRIAWFFDGLDEIGLVAERATMIECIADLFGRYAALGNRFVITSRPAAVQVVDVPVGLRRIQLRGLTEQEIGRLARNVLRVRISSLSDELSSEEEKLVQRIIEDCRSIPGIRRIARNPLLLTLLVLIYANSGSPSAKRHRVYTQAIQTLVSVRNRDTRLTVLAESDLRRRLGKLALSVCDGTVGEIPTWSDAVSLVAEILVSEEPGMAESAEAQAEQFLQETAEATGLLVIHPDGRTNDSRLLTFMHHSFLEYYAAIGLLSDTRQMRDAATLVGVPKWKHVLTLMTGILGDYDDITDFIQTLTKEKQESDRITQLRVLFAFDCAIECDVPPKRVQKFLVDCVADTLRNGVAVVSERFRREIGQRLGKLLEVSGSSHVVDMLCEGILSDNLSIRAASIELTGYVGKEINLPGEVIQAYEQVSDCDNVDVMCAELVAMSMCSSMRGDRSKHILQRSLKRGMSVKWIALRTLVSVPGLAKQVWEELLSLLDDSDSMTAGLAAQALLSAGVRMEPEQTGGALIGKCLAMLENAAHSDTIVDIQFDISKMKLDTFLGSHDLNTRLLATRMLAWISTVDDRFVYNRSMSILGRDEARHEEKRAVLNTLSLSANALQLITLADTEAICRLTDGGTRDVRIAALRLLGRLPSDQLVLEALYESAIRLFGKNMRYQEYSTCLLSLAEHGRRDLSLQEFFHDNLQIYIHKYRPGFGDKEQQRHFVKFLKSTEDVGGQADVSLASDLRKIVEDYRSPQEVRNQALRTFGNISNPEEGDINFIVQKLKDSRMTGAAAAAAVHILRNARHLVRRARILFPWLPRLRSALCGQWRATNEENEISIRLNDVKLQNVRVALQELDKLATSYDEFSRMIKIDSLAKGTPSNRSHTITEKKRLAAPDNNERRRTAMNEDTRAMKVFISRHKNDHEICGKLMKHLSPLVQKNMVEVWEEDQVEYGEEYLLQIEEKINEADMVICLLSSDYIASDYHMKQEMEFAMHRRADPKFKLLPLRVRSVDLSMTDFAGFRIYPERDQSISTADNQDKALAECAKVIRDLVLKGR